MKIKIYMLQIFVFDYKTVKLMEHFGSRRNFIATSIKANKIDYSNYLKKVICWKLQEILKKKKEVKCLKFKLQEREKRKKCATNFWI